MRQWRLLYDMPTTGADNMAIDEAVLEAVSRREMPPTLRLYGWSPPCLSLGCAQKLTDVDLDRLRARGWGLVRRPTGGRAILHADELTYSVAVPADDPLAAGGILESYHRISAALLAGLRRLGAPVAAQRLEERLSSRSAVCFDAAARYELTVAGRKLVGSAQARRKGGILQHGSLPLSGDVARICDLLAYPDEAAREGAKAHVRRRAITLSEALGRDVSWREAANAAAQGFAETFEIEFCRAPLPPHVQQYAARLAAEVYSQPERPARRYGTP